MPLNGTNPPQCVICTEFDNETQSLCLDGTPVSALNKSGNTGNSNNNNNNNSSSSNTNTGNTNTAICYPNLSQGDSGSAVGTLQQALNNNGYSLTVDGQFAVATEQAVQDYQKKIGELPSLPITVDQETWLKLGFCGTGQSDTQYGNTNQSSTQSVTCYPNLSEGSTDATTSGAVTILQKALNSKGYTVGVDGQFGTETDTAVRKFQTDNQSQTYWADGIVGPLTWTALGYCGSGTNQTVSGGGSVSSAGCPSGQILSKKSGACEDLAKCANTNYLYQGNQIICVDNTIASNLQSYCTKGKNPQIFVMVTSLPSTLPFLPANANSVDCTQPSSDGYTLCERGYMSVALAGGDILSAGQACSPYKQ
jgi:peptidoglycan hydrolase-like protein with peptidoglycan-binding domain